MADPHSLYPPILLRHAREPRLRAPAPAGAQTFHALNRSCGDRIALHVVRVADRLVARFEGDGCALLLASASALTEALDGATHAEASAVVAAFTALVDPPQASLSPSAPPIPALPPDLAAFAAVSAFPARWACVRVALSAATAALADPPAPPL